MSIYLFDAGRLAVAVMLLLAGGAKLLSPHPLAAALVKAYPGTATRPGLPVHVARGTAAVEVLAALLAATQSWVTAGLALAAVVGLGVTAFAVSAVVLDRRTPCGCFGVTGDKPLGLRNALAGLALAAGAALLLAAGSGDPLGYAGSGALLGAASVLTLVITVARHRAALMRPIARHFQGFAR